MRDGRAPIECAGIYAAVGLATLAVTFALLKLFAREPAARAAAS
jgi:hypothetical protein